MTLYVTTLPLNCMLIWWGNYEVNAVILLVTGSRSSLVNMEARPLTSEMLTRRCVVTRLSDLTIERFKEAVQTLGAGALLILIPKNTSLASLEQKEVNICIPMKQCTSSDTERDTILIVIVTSPFSMNRTQFGFMVPHLSREEKGD